MIPIVERKMMMPINEQHRTVSIRVVEPEAPRINVVYFHRFGGGSLEFMVPAQRLASFGCRVSCMEYVGHSASEWLPPADYSPVHDVQFARTLLAAQDDLPLVIIGNGWGGHIALQSMGAASRTPDAIFLFDYVNSFTYATDIIMPFEAEAASIVARSLQEFEASLSKLARPLGKFGHFLAELCLSRALDVGDLVSLRIDPNAYRPFREAPDQVLTSGHFLGQPPCEIMIVNGALARFKNLLRPPESGFDIPRQLKLVEAKPFSYLSWSGKGAADALVSFLRKKNILEHDAP